MSKGRNKTVSEKLLEKALDKANRADNTIHPTRLNRLNVLRMAYGDLVEGATRQTIEEKLLKGEYGLEYKKSSVKGICYELYDMIKLDFQAEKPILKEKLYAMLQDIYFDARQNGDRSNALKAISEIAKITGIYTENSPKASLSLKSGDNEITIDFGLTMNTESSSEINDFNAPTIINETEAEIIN